jgi:type II restriction enzyme
MAKYIKSASDLVTTHKAIRGGFLEQAVSKGIQADPYIIRAQEFSAALKKVKSVEDLLSLNEFKEEIVAAAGFSTKATNNLNEKELNDAVEKSLKSVLLKNDFKTELVQRYLLTKGDALGGTMRNIIGSTAGEKFTSFVIKALKEKGIQYETKENTSGKIQAVFWKNRYLLFDFKPKLIGKNIDAILINTSNCLEEIGREVFEQPGRYVACGELKGGIDPAGADEHWKTANSALERIRDCFMNLDRKPALFFVGAAIEVSMANEIYRQLQNKKLTFAANLNNSDQVEDLANWLTQL